MALKSTVNSTPLESPTAKAAPKTIQIPQWSRGPTVYELYEDNKIQDNAQCLFASSSAAHGLVSEVVTAALDKIVENDMRKRVPGNIIDAQRDVLILLDLLLVLVVGLVVAVAFHFVATLTRAQLLLHLRTRFDAKLTLGFVDHMMRLPYAFFERRQAADLQLRIGSVQQIREVVSLEAWETINELHLWLGEQRTPAEHQADRLGLHLTRTTGKET